MRREIDDKLRAASEFVKCTDLSYPHRASIRGFLGAALTVNATAGALPRHLDAELRAHLGDALKPLGFGIVRMAGRNASHSGLRMRAPAKIRTVHLDEHP